MNRSATTKVSRLLVQQFGQRYFSSSSSTPPSYSAMNIGISKINSRPIGTGWARISMLDFQNLSTLASGAAIKEKAVVPPLSSAAHIGSDGGDHKKGIVSYWGVSPPQLTKEDGSTWTWNCFRPWETYKADVNIDVKKHHTPSNITDKIAFWTVEVLKFNTRLFFQKRHMCHAMLLETVAAVPGMVGGMLLHCKSLRKFEHSGGWIKLLLEEAENERMHLMTFIEIAKPRWYERALVFTVQGLFVNAYFLAYVASPKLAHRICGYLEEEAVNSYTEFLNDLDKGLVENVPAPAIAIDYWRLPPDSTLRDVVTVIRADEAHHRDINHFASDIHSQGHELKDYAAPLNYH